MTEISLQKLIVWICIGLFLLGVVFPVIVDKVKAWMDKKKSGKENTDADSN